MFASLSKLQQESLNHSSTTLCKKGLPILVTNSFLTTWLLGMEVEQMSDARKHDMVEEGFWFQKKQSSCKHRFLE